MLNFFLKGARWIAHRTIGDLVAIGVSLTIAVVPFLRDYNLIQSRSWLWGWAILYGLHLAYERYAKGLSREAGQKKLAEIHGSLSGAIDVVTQRLLDRPNRTLTEHDCQELCVPILHRIKDYTAHMLSAPEGVRLRATLAVPVTNGGENGRRQLRVWAYDETYRDRRYTALDLDGEPLMPGAPIAYTSGEFQIIDDITKLNIPEHLKRRDFRSVLSICISAGGPSGPKIGVLNIDATEARFFKVEAVQRKVLPLIGPSVNLLELILLLKEKDAAYVFPHTC